MSYDESPRSVYWPPNYSGHHYIHHQHSWSDQPRPQIRQVHSNDTYFPAPRLVPETRYESETYERSPYYQRYQPSPPAFRPPPPPMPIFRQPIFHPPVKPVPRLMQHKPHRFLPARHPQPPKHAYPGRSEQKPERLYREQIEKRESFDEVQVQRTSAKQSEQEEEEKEKQQQEEVEKSKEEAAVDAILSLKSGGIVAPPKIKRLVHREKASAFKIYDQARSDGSSSHIETLKPGLYLTMRSN